jgi:D-3-phosphoglycerate dehydrogenase
VGDDKARVPASPCVILVGNKSSPGSNAILDELQVRLGSQNVTQIRYPQQSDLLEDVSVLQVADVLVAPPGFALTRQLMSAGPRLRAAVSLVTGTEGYDLAAATELGICIANGHTRENYESMAEATVMLMLALLYDLHGTEELARKGLLRPARPRAMMLRDKTIGLIGFGRIARAIAERLQGWHVKMLAYAPRPGKEPWPTYVSAVSLEELLQTSDIISLHAPISRETRGMLNAERLGMIKPGAFLINTARGGIIDEEALVKIARARLSGIALDVTETKPLPADSPLWKLPKAILTPHMVGHTLELHDSQVEAAYQNIYHVLSGKLPPHLCNPEVAQRWSKKWKEEILL